MSKRRHTVFCDISWITSGMIDMMSMKLYKNESGDTKVIILRCEKILRDSVDNDRNWNRANINLSVQITLFILLIIFMTIYRCKNVAVLFLILISFKCPSIHVTNQQKWENLFVYVFSLTNHSRKCHLLPQSHVRLRDFPSFVIIASWNSPIWYP